MTYNKGRIALIGLLASAAFVGISPASAQDQNEAAKATPSDKDEIIVTARRSAESERDVPISMEVVGGEQIQNQGIEDVQRLAETVPSLVVGGQDPTLGGVNLTIRGIGSNAGDPAVGYYIDEVYIPNPSGFVSQFIDTERVEVLSGPQGTLFGRNTTGGVVHYITKQPGREFGVEAYGELGWYDSLRFDSVPFKKIAGAVNVPLSNAISARVSIAKVMQDNYTFNLERNSPEPNQNAFTIRAAIAIRPSDRFELLLNADYINDPNHNSFLYKNRATPGTAIEFINDLITDIGPEANPFRVRSNLSPVADYEELGLRAKATFKITDELELRSITGYRELTMDRFADLDSTQATLLHNASQQDDKSFSQELQVYYENDRFNVIGGLYYFDRKFSQDAQAFASTPFFLLTSCNGNNPPIPGISGFCPLVNSVATGFIPLLAGRQPILADFLPGGLFETLTGLSASTTTALTTAQRDFRVKSYAGYVQGNFKLNDHVSLTAGARYTSDKKDISALTIAGGIPALVEVNDTFSAFTPKVGVEYRPSDNVLAYASITRGFKSGDANLFGASVVGEIKTVDPETVWSYEAGMKSALADGKLLLDFGAFLYDYKNYQMNVQFAEGPRIFNLDKVQVYGIEFKPVFRLTPRLRLGASATYLHSRVKKSSRLLIDPFDVLGGPLNPVGESLPQSPKFKGNAFIGYSAPIGDTYAADFAVDATYSSRFNNDLFGSFPNDSYSVINANVRFGPTEGRWYLNVYGRNLFNEVYTTSSLFADGIGELEFYAPPRTIGVQLGFKY